MSCRWEPAQGRRWPVVSFQGSFFPAARGKRQPVRPVQPGAHVGKGAAGCWLRRARQRARRRNDVLADQHPAVVVAVEHELRTTFLMAIWKAMRDGRLDGRLRPDVRHGHLQRRLHDEPWLAVSFTRTFRAWRFTPGRMRPAAPVLVPPAGGSSADAVLLHGLLDLIVPPPTSQNLPGCARRRWTRGQGLNRELRRRA